MIETTVLKFLTDELSVPAYMEEPEKPEKSYVLIEKVGSDEENHIFSATISVRSYAESLFDTATLNAEVKAVMDKLIECENITKCSLNSDYNSTDTETKRYCYMAIFDITYYE